MPTRIKICGITRTEDALAASAAGAHAIGLMFYAQSPRYLETGQAQAVRACLPPFVSAVAVFLDASGEAVQDVVNKVKPDMLQFHGAEPEDFCAGFGLPYIKTIPMQGQDAVKFAAAYPSAAAFLLDGHALGEPGGSGRGFELSHIPASLSAPVILAGGLNPDNVTAAVQRARPYAVDVSSGVEARPGIKDAALIEAFVKGVNRGDLE